MEDVEQADDEISQGEGIDPFTQDNAPIVSLIVQMRLYDVMMALLNEQNPEAAAALHRVHAQGGILGSLPYIDLTEEEAPRDLTEEDEISLHDEPEENHKLEELGE
jgi:hypothetical protein